MELKLLGLTKTDRLMEEPCSTYLIEMRPCLEQEEKRRQYRKASARQVGVVEATQLLCDAAPGHQPDTDTYIPTS